MVTFRASLSATGCSRDKFPWSVDRRARAQYPSSSFKIALSTAEKIGLCPRPEGPSGRLWLEHMHRTCREKLFESSPTSPSRTFEHGTTSAALRGGKALSQIKITLCNRRRGGPCGGAEGGGSEDLHTEYGVKSLSKPRRGGSKTPLS